jgi:hypothetical protein
MLPVSSRRIAMATAAQATMTDPESSDLDLRPDESRVLGEESGAVR